MDSDNNNNNNNNLFILSNETFMNEKDVYKSCNVHARTRQSCNFNYYEDFIQTSLLSIQIDKYETYNKVFFNNKQKLLHWLVNSIHYSESPKVSRDHTKVVFSDRYVLLSLSNFF